MHKQIVELQIPLIRRIQSMKKRMIILVLICFVFLIGCGQSNDKNSGSIQQENSENNRAPAKKKLGFPQKPLQYCVISGQNPILQEWMVRAGSIRVFLIGKMHIYHS